MPVDRVREGPADTRVIDRCTPPVESEVPGHEPGSPLDDGLVVGNGAFGEVRVEDVVAAALPPIGRHVPRLDLDHHLADISVRSIPVGGGFHHDAVLVATGEDERAVADERARAMPVGSVALVDMPRPGAKLHGVAEQVEEVASGLDQLDHQRSLVKRTRAHSIQQVRVRDVVLDHPGVREREVVRGDGRAVAPARVLANRELVRPTVVRDGEALGEIGLDLEVAPDRDEPAEELATDLE